MKYKMQYKFRVVGKTSIDIIVVGQMVQIVHLFWSKTKKKLDRINEKIFQTGGFRTKSIGTVLYIFFENYSMKKKQICNAFCIYYYSISSSFFFFSFIVKIYTDELFNVCSVGYLLQSEYNMN